MFSPQNFARQGFKAQIVARSKKRLGTAALDHGFSQAQVRLN